jgi:Cdc6-like AAA superfamily ATPase
MSKRAANFPQRPVTFINDEPSRTDSFDTHSDIAAAIATAIETNRSLKVIGLLGRWGSGKSTVIRFLSDILKRFKPSDRQYRVFNYDAWLHQNDAPRISFMSSLVSDLQAEGDIDEEKWDSELKLLTGQLVKTDTVETPTLTSDAKLLGILIFLFTIGLSLFGFDVVDKATSTTASTRNATVFLTASLALMLIPVGIWVVRVLWSRRSDAENLSWFPPILLNKDLARTSTRTERSPEPTSIEFGRSFQRLMRDLEAKKVHLVIIIDNIDRVSNEEALEIWANIRMLFLGTHSASIDEHQTFHPSVILPVDHHAIRALFQKDGGDDEAADSFVDKTFDATFTVTEPVLSDWRSFLRKQIDFSLGASVSKNEAFQIVRLLEKSHHNHKTYKRTPRKLNKLVNKISALWLQWSSHDIQIITVAYYAIFQKEIEEDLLSFVLSENSDLSALVDGWQTEVCAIHYGVAPHKSAQVLIKAPLYKAIQSGSFEQFETLVETPGFGDTFAAICSEEEFDLDSDEEAFDFYLNAAHLLAQIAPASERVWAKHSWAHLANLILKYVPFGSIKSTTRSRLEAVFPFLPPQKSTQLLSHLRNIVEEKIGPELTKDQARILGHLTQFLADKAEGTDFELTCFRTNLKASDILNVISAFEDHPKMWNLLEVDLEENEFTSEVVKAAASADKATSVTTLLKIISKEKNRKALGLEQIDWAPIKGAVLAAVGNPPSQPALQSQILEVLIHMCGIDAEWKDAITQLADSGQIAARINDAANSNEISASSAGIALLIVTCSPDCYHSEVESRSFMIDV